MINLKVTIKEGLTGATEFLLTPDTVYLGGRDNNGIDTVKVECPEEWQGKTVRVTLTNTQGIKTAVILNNDREFMLDDSMLSVKGKLTVDCFDATYHAYTNDVLYEVYAHQSGGSSNRQYSQSEVDQVLTELQTYVNAETERVAAETERKSAEDIRVENEADRQIAEAERASADAERQAGFASRISAVDSAIAGIVSPTVTVKSNKPTEYVLTVTDKNGSYDTPNLKGKNGDGSGDMLSSDYDSNNDGVVNKADIAYKDENGRDITQMMQRYVMRLTKSGETYYLTDYVSGATLSFTDIYNKTRDTSLYVVCVYGASKLRPQYVNSTEMIFLGIDRATSSKVLRLHITPSSVAYRTYELAEKSEVYTKSEIDTSLGEKVPTSRTVNGHALSSDVTISKSDVGLGNVTNVKQMPISGGTFTGAVQADSVIRTGDYLRNINVKASDGSTDVSTMTVYFTRK